MKPLKKSVTITLDEPILEQTKRLAEREDRSLSSYINLLLKAHLERMEKNGADGAKKPEMARRSPAVTGNEARVSQTRIQVEPRIFVTYSP